MNCFFPINIGSQPTADASNKGTKGKTDPHLTTSFELFCGHKPDMRTLFDFGAVGFFRRERDSNQSRGAFESQTYPGLALSRSLCTNAMIFWSPETNHFSVSADCELDVHRDINDFWPTADMAHDGGLELRLCSHNNRKLSPCSLGTPVHFQMPGPTGPNTPPDVGVGVAVGMPEKDSTICDIELEDDARISLDVDKIWGEHDAIGGGEFNNIDPTQEDPLHPIVPSWVKSGTKTCLN